VAPTLYRITLVVVLERIHDAIVDDGGSPEALFGSGGRRAGSRQPADARRALPGRSASAREEARVAQQVADLAQRHPAAELGEMSPRVPVDARLSPLTPQRRGVCGRTDAIAEGRDDQPALRGNQRRPA